MTTRIPGFYRLDVEARRERIASERDVDFSRLDHGGIDIDTANTMIENVVGTYALPFGIALNFKINDTDYFVPMAIEEPSVVAAASHAAKFVRDAGGFIAEVTDPIMIGQVQLCNVPDPDTAVRAVADAEAAILEKACELAPRLVARGGGPRFATARVLSRPGDPDGGMVVVHIHVDCRDAMGANLVNTIAEGCADLLAGLTGGTVGLRILSNLCTDRMVRVTCRIPVESFGGAAIADTVVAASRFAELDPYRATTHNKGIMNGVDAVLVATGNDWRGAEASSHAYACQDGQYRPLSIWRRDGDDLMGQLEMPLAVGTVGGAVQVHSGAQLALSLLAAKSAGELASVAAAAGLACNLSALRALGTDGIQRGHMSLHARVVAKAVGATGTLVDRVANEIAALGDVKPERAREILSQLGAQPLAPATDLGDGK